MPRRSRRLKMRAKPELLPRGEVVYRTVSINDGDNLQMFADFADSVEDWRTVTVEFDYYGYDGGHHAHFKFARTETDEEYAVRVQNYEKELVKYNEWYEENKEEIISRATKNRETNKKRLETLKKNAEAELKRIQKQLSAIE